MVGRLHTLSRRRAIELGSLLGSGAAVILEDRKGVVGAKGVTVVLKAPVEVQHALVHALPAGVDEVVGACAGTEIRDSVQDGTAFVVLAAVVALVTMGPGAILARVVTVLAIEEHVAPVIVDVVCEGGTVVDFIALVLVDLKLLRRRVGTLVAIGLVLRATEFTVQTATSASIEELSAVCKVGHEVAAALVCWVVGPRGHEDKGLHRGLCVSYPRSEELLRVVCEAHSFEIVAFDIQDFVVEVHPYKRDVGLVTLGGPDFVIEPVRKEMVVNDSQDIEAEECNAEVLDQVITRGAKDGAGLDDSIECSEAVVVNVGVCGGRVLGGEGVDEHEEVVAPALHATELVCEVLIAEHGRPQAHTVRPAVAVDRHVGVVDAWFAAWLVDRAAVVLVLVDLNGEVDHVVLCVYLDARRRLHGGGVCREDHVLREVVLSVEFRQVVV